MIPLLDAGLRIIDKIIPDPAERERARLELLRLQQEGELSIIESQAGIIQAEASSEHVLTSTWRPIVMLTFTGLIVLHFVGITPDNLSEPTILELFRLVEIGLGGYVIGRSAEKVAKEWKK